MQVIETLYYRSRHRNTVISAGTLYPHVSIQRYYERPNSRLNRSAKAFN